MAKRNLKNILLFTFLFGYIVLYRTVVLTKFLEYNEAITATFTMLIFALSYLLLGYRKSKLTQLKKSATIYTLIIVMIYFMFSYTYGMFAGFLKNSYSLKFADIINNSIFIIISTVFFELYRFNMIRNNRDKKWVVIILTILSIIFEIFLSVRRFNYYGFQYTFKVITTLILPIIVKNMVLSYNAYHIGYQPNLIYKLLTETYIYFIPIIPNLNDYLNSVIGVVLPIVMYLYVSRMIYEAEHGVEKELVKKSFNFMDIPIYVVIVIICFLISKAFPYYALGIGSGSMSGSIELGDAVIVKKYKNEEELKLNDIIVYNHDGSTIVHRLVEIKGKGKNKKYITKGDFNNAKDDIELSFENIEGRVVLKIPYIGYPSIWISDLIKER